MSEFAREALPIFFMYGVVLLLGPLIGVTMWMAFDGDRNRSSEASESTVTNESTVTSRSSTQQASHPREARGAA